MMRYSMVDVSQPWATLLFRISGGRAARWPPCQSDGASAEVSGGGELVFSINSIYGQRAKPHLPFVAIKDNRNWLPDCGASQVRALVPQFEMTQTLPGFLRRMALKRYL